MPFTVDDFRKHPKAYDIYVHTPGLSWDRALKQSGEAAEATSFATEVAAETMRLQQKQAVAELTRSIASQTGLSFAESRKRAEAFYADEALDAEVQAVASRPDPLAGDNDQGDEMADPRTKAEVLADLTAMEEARIAEREADDGMAGMQDRVSAKFDATWKATTDQTSSFVRKVK